MEEEERRRGEQRRGEAAADVETLIPFRPFSAIKGRGWSRRD